MCYHVDIDRFSSQSFGALVLDILHSLEMVGRAHDTAKRIWNAKAVANVPIPLSMEKKVKKVMEAPVPNPPNRHIAALSRKDKIAASKKDKAASRKKGKLASSKKDKAYSRKKDRATSKKKHKSSDSESTNSD